MFYEGGGEGKRKKEEGREEEELEEAEEEGGGGVKCEYVITPLWLSIASQQGKERAKP